MRVTIVTQDDPLYILPFFQGFFSEDLGPIEVTAIYACPPMGGRKRTQLLKELVILYGVSGFIKLLAIQVWSRIASLSPMRSATLRQRSIKAIAKLHGIHFERIGNPNSATNYEHIANQSPEVLVSVACPYIFKAKLLGLPTLAAINIHHAPLPRYKGMMPTFWQMYYAEKEAAITIHTMALEVDGGETIAQVSFLIRPRESMHQLIRRSKNLGGKVMLGVLKQMARSSFPRSTPVSEEGSYFTFPTPWEMKEFRRRGLRAI